MVSTARRHEVRGCDRWRFKRRVWFDDTFIVGGRPVRGQRGSAYPFRRWIAIALPFIKKGVRRRIIRRRRGNSNVYRILAPIPFLRPPPLHGGGETKHNMDGGTCSIIEH